MKLRELTLKENETLISTQGQQPHNFSARAQVGQGIEWPKATGTGDTTNVKRDEVEMPGEHHVVHHGDTHDGHGVSESIVKEVEPVEPTDDKVTKGLQQLATAGVKLQDLPAFTKDGTNMAKVAESDRIFVVVKIGGANVPYYISTGEGGKASVPTGKWYPFFGLGSSGWLNKGSEQSINKFYGSGLLKTYANLLNLRLGNLQGETLPVMKKTARDVINKDMLDPQNHFSTNEEAVIFKKRINAILQKIGSEPFYAIQAAESFEVKEFAPAGRGDGDSGRWYTDDELADIIGDDWFEDFDVSHDEFNIDAYGEKAKQNLASYANSWFDDKGYNVNVMGVDHNDVDHDLKWYIVGSFHNPNFADKDVEENRVMEDGEATSTVSADIATVAYPMTRGRTRREKRRNARRAVGQKYTPGPAGVGTGVFEASLATMRDYFAGNDDAHDQSQSKLMRDYFSKIDKDIPETIQRIIWKVKNNVALKPLEFSQYKTWMNNRRKMKEAHVLDHQSVIYRLDKDKPMTDTEVLVLGGAGRYTLGGLRDKARREAEAMATDLKVEHGGSFRRAAENIKQLTNTLNTIVAAYNELKRIRSRGGRGSRGITDEESNFMRECSQRMNTLELYTQRVRQAQRIVEGIHRYLKEDKMNPEQASIIKGMFHLNTDPGYGFYRYAIHVAGNHGGDKVVLGPNAGPFAYAYTDEENKMIRDAVKAITGKEPVELTGGKSKEPDFVNKNSTVPSIDWKKVK